MEISLFLTSFLSNNNFFPSRQVTNLKIFFAMSFANAFNFDKSRILYTGTCKNSKLLTLTLYSIDTHFDASTIENF